MSEENVTPENIEEAVQVAGSALDGVAQEVVQEGAQEPLQVAGEVPQQPFSQPYEQPMQGEASQQYAQQQYAQQQYAQPQTNQQQQYAQPQPTQQQQYGQQPNQQQQYDQQPQPNRQQQYYAQPQYGQQQQYAQPAYGQPVQAPYGTASDPGTTPLVLGILSLVAVFIFGFTFIGPIVGIVLGVLGMSKGKQVLQTWPENGRAKGGRITGIIGLIFSILALILSLVFVVLVGGLTMQALEDPDAFISQMDEFVQYDSTGELQQQLDELEQQLDQLNGNSNGSGSSTSPFMLPERSFDMLC